MPVLPNELAKVIDSVEQTERLDEHVIADAVRAVGKPLKDSGAPLPLGVQAEWMAFDFCEDCADEGGLRGTYFGPSVGYPQNGRWVEWPHVQLVTSEILDYWEARSTEAKHPILRARYADLVCDMTPKVRGQRAAIAVFHTAIDTYTEIVEKQLCEYWQKAIPMAERALSLAISVSSAADRSRIVRLKDAILALDRAHSSDDDGGWVAFDLLIGNKKIDLAPEVRDKLVAGQERILATGVQNAEEAKGFPFSVDHAAERLLVHYRSAQRHDDVKRVGALWARAKIAMAKSAMGNSGSAMLGAAWLRSVHATLAEFGCSAEAEAVAVALREFDKRSVDEMVTHTQKVEIPRKELDDWVTEMLEGDFSSAVMRIVEYFIPDPGQAEEQIKKAATQSPLMSFLRISQVDAQGRQVVEVGPVKDDLEGRVIQQMSQNLKVEAQFLHYLMGEFKTRHNVTAELLLHEIAKSPLFEADRHTTLSRGLEACLSGDHALAAHLLIPQIEHAMRNLVLSTGGSGRKLARRHGGIQVKTLGDLLLDDGVMKVLGPDVPKYLQLILTDPRGWNLRNDLLHGILNPDSLGWASTERILHIVLLLGTSRAKPEKK